MVSIATAVAHHSNHDNGHVVVHFDSGSASQGTLTSCLYNRAGQTEPSPLVMYTTCIGVAIAIEI